MKPPALSTNSNNPCIRNCCLDNNDICIGCGRSLEEILNWHDYDDEQRQLISGRNKHRLESK